MDLLRKYIYKFIEDKKHRERILLEKAGFNNYAADSQVSTESRKEPKFITQQAL
jgi:hypothetical protein